MRKRRRARTRGHETLGKEILKETPKEISKEIPKEISKETS